MTPIRVLLADDEPLIRSGLRVIVESAEDITVVGEAADATEAHAQTTALKPDLILMDIRMPGGGLAATRSITAARSHPRILILTTFDTDQNVADALRAGADGFLLKDSPPRTLLAAIRTAVNGDTVFAPAVTKRLIARFETSQSERERTQGARRQLRDLTERELEVLQAVGRGWSNSIIASALFLSEATVKTYVSRILDKTDRTNRVQLAMLSWSAFGEISGHDP